MEAAWVSWGELWSYLAIGAAIKASKRIEMVTARRIFLYYMSMKGLSKGFN